MSSPREAENVGTAAAAFAARSGTYKGYFFSSRRHNVSHNLEKEEDDVRRKQ